MGAFALALLMVIGLLPTDAVAASTDTTGVIGQVSTVSDPDTIRRHEDVYQDDTLNAGKVTVGKSVSDDPVKIKYDDEKKTATFDPADDNFIVTVSQTAQVMGLASESAAPVDVVFVLDTSNSMQEEVNDLVAAANSAIETLLKANPNNRVGVVAFSGTQGGGTSGGAAANVLSPLAHYDGAGETAHLTLQGGYMYGRGMQGTTRLNRDATSQGTNIHAGVVVGARELLNATDITVNGVTRIPFLVVMSDGEPSYAINNANWYNPSSLTSQLGNLQQAAGLGFLPALTAAYYKGAITEKYFGTKASATNRCFVYTLGLGLESISNRDLALMAMDPKNQTASNSFYNTFEGYWEDTTAPISKKNFMGGEAFTVATNNWGGTYTISADSIKATKNFVTGLSSTGTSLGYTGGYKYNDAYFPAAGASDLTAKFNEVVVNIQQQAMAAPTHVEDNHGEDFSGYVTFTDPIGEYMEVKGLHGMLANGKLYEGKSFAQYMQNWASAPAAFKSEFINVLKQRCEVTGATMNAEDFIAKAVASSNQAYYNSETDYNNSLVWWGKSYTPAGEEDPHVQWVGFADNDTMEYITDPATVIPAGADYVCRSYYFYGTAGGLGVTEKDFMHFVVRVQRSLTAPYQQTVVVSAPASLLSMEKVFVTEKTDISGNKTYYAKVTETEPVRVVYEVGLREDINAFNIDAIVGADAAYTGEVDSNGDKVNYDPTTGEYVFYTNDWYREETETSHHRAMTKATFDAAATNSFYAYTKDTQILVKDGSSYVPYTGTTAPVGEYYYARTYYDWTGATKNADGTYNATAKVAYIEVDMPADAKVTKKTDGWYINKGVYTASALSSVADVPKAENKTGTAVIVSHPHRTEDDANAHYTTLLGNNGKLTLKSEKTKSVDITKADSTVIKDADGKVVMVGDTLTYKVRVPNFSDEDVTATVTDKIPAGTEYVAGSADNSGTYAAGVITWTDISVEAGKEVVLTFQVKVTEAALSGDLDVVTIDNTAHVKFSNGFEFDTNTVKNPPEGKKVTDSDGNPITGGVAIPDVLVYRIRWHNNTDKKADVTITDVIPAGTTYVAGSASHGGQLLGDTLTWVLEDVEAGKSGVVFFRVNVDATAGDTIANKASIEVENDPVVRVTNEPTVDVEKGDLEITKTVTGYPSGAADKTFTLTITEISLDLKGKFDLLRDGVADGKVEFKNGQATVTIQGGQKLTIKDLPAGAIFSVKETAVNGFTATYTVGGVNSAEEGRVTVPVTAAASVAITNAYSAAPATFQLHANKTLDTDVPMGDTEFGFLIYRADASGTPTTSTPMTGEVVVSSSNKTASIAFSPATFTGTGTYYYLIQEVNGGVTGVQYTEKQYLLEVTVTDNGSGQLKTDATLRSRDSGSGAFGAEVAYTDGGVSFTNKYVPLETSLTLEGDKILTGRDLAAGEFSFEVKEGANVVSTGTNKANGEIVFKPITYKTAGSHTYTITEVNGGLAGVEYSVASFTVTVDVANVGGQLVATPSYPSGGVKFTNVFTPDDVTLVLEADKTLVNNTGNSAFNLADKQFSFLVEDALGNEVAAGTNDGTGKIVFTPIVFSEAGTYTYTVRELVPEGEAKDPNMFYDPAKFTVEVVVTYDSVLGKLSVGTPTIKLGSTTVSDMEFENIRQPGHIDVKLKGKKITTHAPAGALSFSFTIADAKTGTVVSGGSAPANGDINFTNLTYTEAGEYYYWIYESNHAGETAHGITYSGARFLAKVVIGRDSENALTKSVTYYDAGVVTETKAYTEYLTAAPIDAADVKFTNDYDADGIAAISAKKELSGRDLVAGDFQFQLERLDNGVKLYATNTASGAITFPSIIFDDSELTADPLTGVKSATFTYKMTEVVTDETRLPGVTYSGKTYYVAVTGIDNGLGVIDTAVHYYSDAAMTTEITAAEVVFKNTYKPTGTSAKIEATKTLTGRDLRAGEFVFNLYYNGVVVDTATNDASGKIVFTRNYPGTLAAGVYEYEIKEVNNSLGGVTYASNVGKVRVTIEDQTALGALKATVTYPDGAVEFNNTYVPAGTAVVPAATKKLTGRELVAGEFSFIVVDKATGNTVSTGTNKANGEITFSPIGYTAKDAGKTFTYTISEVQGNLPGVTYAPETVEMTVAVTDDGAGNLVATETYNGSTTFQNKYAPEGAMVQLEADKTLTGRDMAAGEFSFVASEAATGKYVATGGNEAAANGVTAKVRFSSIGYKQADLGGATQKDFIYKLEEVDTAQGGVTFSGAVYYAKVTVWDNPGTGKLEVKSVSYHTTEACDGPGVTASFKNSYAPASVTVDFPADKTLVNKKLEAGEFTFTLEGMGIKQAKTNDANGVVDFDPITYTEAGTYTYTVTEKVTDESKKDLYTLDDPFTVVVKVTDDQKGNLVAKVGYYINYTGSGSDADLGGIEFINHYTAPALTVPLNTAIAATKTLTGRQEAMKAGEFTFKVYDIRNNVVATGANDAAGKVNFTDFTFDKAGEYHYWIVEDATTGGVVRDERVWEVHILVRYNDVTGKLYVNDADVKTYLVSDNAATEETAPAFVNTYIPTPVSIELTANKKLTGRDGLALKDGEFTFRLMEKDLIVAEAKNDAAGKIVFKMNYTEGGNHDYTIVEVDASGNGITSSTASFAVSVKVTDDQKGKLTAVATYADADRTFVNTYKPGKTEATIRAYKTMVGDKPFAGEIFNFQLVNKNDPAEVYKISNDVNGEIAKTLEFTKAGKYTYVLSELDCEDQRITKDTKTYEIVVDVVDNWDGTLTATVVYPDDTAPTFVNTFKAEPTSAKILAKKELTGRDLEDGEFTFEIYDSHGNKIAEATNNDKGDIAFPEIPLEAEGTYTLTVKEVAVEEEGLTCDDTVFTVKITVINTDGVLSAEVEYVDGDIVFKNTYVEPTEPTEPEETEPEETKPEKPKVPDTGDRAQLGMYTVLLVMGLAGMAALIILPKRKKEY